MKQKRKILVGALVALFILLAIGICCIIHANRTPTAAFYRLSQRDAQALQSALGDAFLYETYTNDISLYAQVKDGKAPDVIFTTTGKPLELAESLNATKKTFPLTLFEGVTSSVRGTIPNVADGEVRSIPLLTNHFEIDINTAMLRKTGLTKIATWEDIEQFAEAAKKIEPDARIIFAGKDGETMLDLIGALTEALNGRRNYDSAVQLIEAEQERAAQGVQAFNADRLAETLAVEGDAPLYDAVRLLKKWLSTGILNTEVFNMDKATVAAFMDAKLASVVFMSLDDHRTVSHNAIEPFSSIYVPSDLPAASRAFTAPIIYAVAFTNQKKARKALEQLISAETQESLSYSSGLAPVLARCRTPDRQADDVRYWVAATNAPLAGLSRETTLSDEQLRALGIALGVIVRTR